MLTNKIEARLTGLKAELANGQKVLAELDAKRSEVRDTIIRISGAIQVLEELLEKEKAEQKETALDERTQSDGLENFIPAGGK